ncbi:MAG TPA: AmmeMemoRadiSam system protein B [Geobacterales bacterium]|jgi:AmmeMemoRadiSam system protein B|nr:AmmeMemoRadiSam system protein B [Geobacterales bacterium]
MIRKSAVAGYFYEKDREALVRQIEGCFKHEFGPGKLAHVSERKEITIPAFIVPHAGYMYSGPVAAHAYKLLAETEKPDIFIILGPNHTGYGELVSIMPQGEWETPLGKVRINEEIAKKILTSYKMVRPDMYAHLYEHSIEVQLPFLQYIFKDFEFVPICIMLQTLEVATELAKVLKDIVNEYSAVVLASTDLNHYENNEITYKKDSKVIENVQNLDAEGLFKAIERYDISMCGPCPTATVLNLSKLIGVNNVKILKHATSGDIEGKKSSVVGYLAAAFEIKRP